MREVGRPARLADVAKAAGVSTATASYVLSGRRGQTRPAAGETAVRIRAVAADLGYVPNRHAQATRRGYSNAVVLALGDPGDPWGAQLTIEVQARAGQRELSTLSLADETWFEFLLGFRPGVAFVTSTDFEVGGLERVEQLSDQGLNLVVFSTAASADRYDVISSSAVEPTREAYVSLRRRHDHVHFLSQLEAGQHRPGPTRVMGYHQGIAACDDLESPQLVHYAGPTRAEAPGACEALLDTVSTPTAVICSTGFLADILRGAALRRGLRVPEDLEIVAIGDIPYNDSDHLGPISHYGVPDVFARIADVVVGRAVRQHEAPFVRHEFEWTFQPGATTISQ